jgi:hypothetical protein
MLARWAWLANAYLGVSLLRRRSVLNIEVSLRIGL